MQKIWYDNEMAQLTIVCSSSIITATAQIYVTDDLIDELIYKIREFLNGQVVESNWANEEKGDQSTACVSLRFLHKDKLGHILVEIYMELDDGGSYSSHNCCFYLHTELGFLERFCESLPQLKQKSLGVKVTLNEDV